MVREVKKEEAKRYLRKSEDFYNAALDELAKNRYDVVVFNASQSIILTNDALCIAFLGKRPSKDHREAIKMHVEASAGKENKREFVRDALEKRGEFAYTEKKATEKVANLLLVNAKKFLDWVKDRVGYE